MACNIRRQMESLTLVGLVVVVVEGVASETVGCCGMDGGRQPG